MSREPAPLVASENPDGSLSPAQCPPSFTTIPHSTVDSVASTIPHLPLSLSMPLQGLRKSMSVDSLVYFGRDGDSAAAMPNSNRSNAGSAFDFSNNHIPERDRFSFGQNRRSSIGSTGDGDESVDSDFERSDPPERYRHASLKSRSHVRGGDLPLPSRTPTLSLTSNMSGTASTSATSSTLDDIPRQASVSSPQPFNGRPVPTTALGRIRSGSLGTYMNSGSYRPLKNHTSHGSASLAPYTFIVVGTAGCGKSTAIQLGLQDQHLSDKPVPVPFMQGSSTKYFRWDGELRSEVSYCPLHIIEIDVPSTHLAPTKPPDWPDSSSTVNGVLICYDASNKSSFNPVNGLLRNYCDLQIPLVVLACKSDSRLEVDPAEACKVASQYDAGVIEAGKAHEDGRRKMREAFGWLIMSAKRVKQNKGKTGIPGSAYQNPASPSILRTQLPRDVSRTAAPQAPSPRRNEHVQNEMSSATPSPNHPASLSSASRTRSTSDLLYEPQTANPAISSTNLAESSSYQQANSNLSQLPEVKKDELESSFPKENKEKESRPGQWATLDDLLDKLLFLGVSGDDPSYITHFFLTYRRFASPRSVILAMQKRIRELDEKSSGDPMFAYFAQMRICHLLELWIRDYPHDFAVPGTNTALNALVTSIVSKTYLLHYGSEFLPFLEMLPALRDHDAAWALEVPIADENDDSYSLLEDEELHPLGDDSASASSLQEQPTAAPSVGVRERKPSYPRPSMSGAGQKTSTGLSDMDEKQQIKDLLRLSQELQAIDSEEIAQEITRIEIQLFLDIKPRHWLSYTFSSGKKDESEPISAFNTFSNHLADWVVSLILCHKTTRTRVKQIEKLVEIAQKLRALNNYSALRAFVAGINNATFTGDETMEQFKVKYPDQAKNLKSWDVLLQHIRSHRAYRLALRNSKGACIPALEVHMSDLIKAHEGNGDFHATDSKKIHWGKFNMMGRFISSTAQCQAQCMTATDYNFVDRSHIRELLERPVMNDQMQKSRIASVDSEVDEYRSTHPGSVPPREAAILRKFVFW